jgi:hypothetical protein
LSGRKLKTHLRTWQGAYAQAIDEISMVPPGLLYRIDVRCRTANQKDRFMRGLATNLSGDYLQIPPVKSRSLAMPIDLQGFGMEDDGDGDKGDGEELGDAAKTQKRKERLEFEQRCGYETRRGKFKDVTVLTRNTRTSGILDEILNGMRAGLLSDAAKRALEDRLLGYVREAGTLKPLPPGVVDPR